MSLRPAPGLPGCVATTPDPSPAAREDELPFLRGSLPGWLRRTRTVLAPGETLGSDAPPCAGALVVVEEGAIDVEGRGGGRVRLRAGAVLWCAGRSPGALCNRGAEPAILVSIFRSPPTVAP